MSASRTAGFADQVHDSQTTFRAIMRAMARPGTIETLAPALAPPDGLPLAAAAACLALADFETPLWLSPRLAARDEVSAFLRFHTGAAAASLNGAAFAVVHGEDAVDLSAFAQGTAEYPDRSTTLILLCDSLDADGPLTLAGPGIQGAARFGFAPMPADFLAQWARNRATFPLGVDLILAAGHQIACLPRSTRILGEAG